MDPLRALTILILVLTTLLGQEAMTSTALICNMKEEGLMSCKPSVTGPRPAPPSRLCCSTLSQADMVCLCKLKDAMPSLGIDPKLAWQLPKKCRLHTRPKC